ncbi:acyl-CoA dehydrogenase family protein [Nonomuraea dietziae]|uniref:Acyl-CoA dehydrogenase n=1 Tax=Nonomuraea dietziae TaxID=65515 RepID=A0A7W5YQW1_9ACTN|nr:acyl-CoA dehydrogenase family protein [Nonomuraea dietziae]MBB3726789.1 acyl-CoA dehydrogenase [Nonomuraea dietziae]
MKLVLGQDQQELRATVRSFLAGLSPREGHRPEVYARLNGELGLSGLIIPEEYGGAGAGLTELAVVLEETGAALLPGPFLANALAAIALTQVPDKELLTAVAEGRLTATVAPLPGGSDLVTASRDGEALVDGRLAQVVNAGEADVLLAPVTRHDGVALVAIDLAGEGVTRTPLTTLDLTRSQAEVVLEGARGRVLGSPPDGIALERAWNLFSVALAAEQLGVMRASLEAIVGYAKIRVAFGRYIGSYQGVKHKLADMHCKLEQAESIVRYAAWAADESPGELPEAAALAQAYVGRACFEVARDHLLLHGGIGFTWEHDAHLYYKRAKADEVLLGPPRTHRERLADLLEL